MHDMRPEKATVSLNRGVEEIFDAEATDDADTQMKTL